MSTASQKSSEDGREEGRTPAKPVRVVKKSRAVTAGFIIVMVCGAILVVMALLVGVYLGDVLAFRAVNSTTQTQIASATSTVISYATSNVEDISSINETEITRESSTPAEYAFQHTSSISAAQLFSKVRNTRSFQTSISTSFSTNRSHDVTPKSVHSSPGSLRSYTAESDQTFRSTKSHKSLRKSLRNLQPTA
ncbi:uncharacterized protein LOC111263575 [Varroa jacobsoni]|uniref:uncharacterized protein LOC111263575 n=1 Tax=Varroa jacobsoni TaxID=62625 RepID=UPI000BF8CC62|nr:uncharacterized protein LOC111263575 [Varroa jacobsoni]